MMHYPMTGYVQICNCCAGLFANAPGARAYLSHLSQATYYGIRMSPEATFALSAQARDFLGGPSSFAAWVADYYTDWQPVGPDIIPAAYGWFNCK